MGVPSHHCLPRCTWGEVLGLRVTGGLQIWALGRAGREGGSGEGPSLPPLGRGPSHKVSPISERWFAAPSPLHHFPLSLQAGDRRGPLLRELPASYSPPQIKAWHSPPSWPPSHTTGVRCRGRRRAAGVLGRHCGLQGQEASHPPWAPSTWRRAGGPGRRGFEDLKASRAVRRLRSRWCISGVAGGAGSSAREG